MRSLHSALLATDTKIDLTESQVKEQFEQWWPKLSERLAALPARPIFEERMTTEPISEVLTLTKGIANSVSGLQAQLSFAEMIPQIREILVGQKDALDQVSSRAINAANRADHAAARSEAAFQKSSFTNSRLIGIRKRQLELREKLREIGEKFRSTEQAIRSSLSAEKYSQVEGLIRILEEQSNILNQIMKNEEESLLEP